MSNPARTLSAAPRLALVVEADITDAPRQRAPYRPRAGVRSTTLSRRDLQTLARAPQEASPEEVEANQALRPRTRAACEYAVRPCPWVGCKLNLYLDVNSFGGLKLNWPDVDPMDIDPAASCALDIANGGATSLVSVGRLLNLTRERVRQLEDIALAKLRAVTEGLDLL
jgi:hypothetical protein